AARGHRSLRRNTAKELETKRASNSSAGISVDIKLIADLDHVIVRDLIHVYVDQDLGLVLVQRLQDVLSYFEVCGCIPDNKGIELLVRYDLLAPKRAKRIAHFFYVAVLDIESPNRLHFVLHARLGVIRGDYYSSRINRGIHQSIGREYDFQCPGGGDILQIDTELIVALY